MAEGRYAASAYLPDTPLTCYVKALSDAGADIHHAGKTAEGRQQADSLADTETRQAQALSTTPVQAKGRVQMTGQDVMGRMRLGFVLQGKGAEQQRFRHDGDPQLHGRVAGAPVMVAAYQRDFQ